MHKTESYLERKALLQRIEDSGESITDFCKRNPKYSVTTLYRWRKEKPPITREAFEALAEENARLAEQVEQLTNPDRRSKK